MIDKLLCFDNGFIKFENGFSLVSGACPGECRFAYFDGELEVFSFTDCFRKHVDFSHIDTFGIFAPDNSCAVSFGESERLKQEFARLYPVSTLAEEFPEDKFSEETVQTIEKIKTVPNTYWDVSGETFEEMISSGEEIKELGTLIPGSKWAKPKDENFIVGIIYDENSAPMYLCYGFENLWSETPPENLDGYCQWIPKDCKDPHEEGYWVIYVNAQTGERIR